MNNLVGGYRQALWNSCENYFRAALEYEPRPISLEMVRQSYLAGQLDILRGARGALLVEVETIDSHRHLHVFLGGGELTELVGVLLPRAESLGRHGGCHSVLISGRKGWARALHHCGYSVLSKGDGWWLIEKQLFPATFKERVKPMSAINYSVSPSFVAIATDTLVTDVGDWFPFSLTAKAAFIPQLDAVITATAYAALLRNCFNYAQTAPVRDILELAAHLPAICKQTHQEAFAFGQTLHPPEEDFSWTESCAVSLFGWSQKHGRLIGLRFAYANDFAPELLFDGVYTHPHVSDCPSSIARENVQDLCDITRRQQECELRKTPTDRNAIGGDILLWELRANSQREVVSSVRRVHRFSTYDEDLSIIQQKHTLAPAEVPPRKEAGGAKVAPVPPGAVEFLRANPSLADQFEAKYGPRREPQVFGELSHGL